MRATFMEDEAKIGIPNLAHRRRYGQEGQRRCKLAMPKLAIYFGCHRPVSMRQPRGDRGGLPSLPIRGFPWAADDRIPRKVTGSRRQVAYWFFCVVQLRTVLVVTPTSRFGQLPAILTLQRRQKTPKIAQRPAYP